MSGNAIENAGVAGLAGRTPEALAPASVARAEAPPVAAPAPASSPGAGSGDEVAPAPAVEVERAALESESARRTAQTAEDERVGASPLARRTPQLQAAEAAAPAIAKRDDAPATTSAPRAPLARAALPGLPGAVPQGLEANAPERAATPPEPSRVASAPPPPVADAVIPRDAQAPALELARPEPIVQREAEIPVVVPAANASSDVASAPSAAAPSTAPRPTPADALPVHVEWLAERGGGSARLELHPPHLGRVEIAVRVRGTDVEVAIAAAEPSAQVVVNGQRDTLAEALGSRDLRLSHFEVGSGGRDEAGADARGRGAESDGFRRNETGAGERSASGPTSSPASALARGSQRPVSSERVDLHV